MKIKIAARFRPFSLLPGSECLIPGTSLIVQAFPTLAKIKRLNGEVIEERSFNSTTLFQDLERGCVELHGKGSLYATKDGFSEQKPESQFQMTRLSFGSHKAQDVDLIRRRLDPYEVMPLLFKLAQYYPKLRPVNLNVMEEYRAGFSPFFVPRLLDTDHTGFSLIKVEQPLERISLVGSAITSMVIEEEEETIFLHVPTPFGRLVDFEVADGKISMEWSKGFMRQVIYETENPKEVKFPKSVKRFKVKTRGKSFLFDNFEG